MGYNFLPVDREQLMLLPESMAGWLPEDHLAWFVIETVDGLDLSAFRAAYRCDGRGGAAFDPSMMLALLIYAYCVGEPSSRRIERRLVEDVAFRVVAGNQCPDHATIARFRVVHEQAIGALFGQVLGVCARAGVLRAGLVAIDGTKMAANASRSANMTMQQIAEELLAEAAEVDAAEDAEELSADDQITVAPELRGRAGRRARLKAMLDELNAEAASKSYEAVVAARAAKSAATGRPARGAPPRRDAAMRKSRQSANRTDPDSRLVKTKSGFIQGYNAQAVATEDQYVLAAEVGNGADQAAFVPVIKAAKQNLRRSGSRSRVRRVVADAGYFTVENVNLAGVETFIAPGRSHKLADIGEAEQSRAAVLDKVHAGELTTAQAATELNCTLGWVRQLVNRRKQGKPDSTASAMVAKLDTPRGKRTYKKRAGMIEPVFGQTKHNRKLDSFSRRGLTAADSEWKLICATHNLLKLYRHA